MHIVPTFNFYTFYTTHLLPTVFIITYNKQHWYFTSLCFLVKSLNPYIYFQKKVRKCKIDTDKVLKKEKS